ncbi:amino acid adenylation domain-containing protein [Solihabitans fulvus]|uniref:Amino acid adenylation domain-containing protein n=1 Tax=Solihabitans fulvus TaxID=1892852 RepID=A0A5B2XSD9_9PSEU|nr:non-ribosomal peptide synthetase [Solihabitans fulvus]KAA2265769.1 amino acid adenylation domain-containing protein [Solihabitans fulvus]
MLSSLLGELARAGIKLRLATGDRLEVAAPRGALTPELRDRIAGHKVELVGWLARADEHATGGPALTPDPAAWTQPFAPSDLQVSYLVGSREGLEYHVRPHQYMEWDYPLLDPARFEHALNRTLRRQRANLMVLREDMRLQAVGDPNPVRVGVTDVRALPETQALAEVERVRERMQRREPPLDRWPWLDAHLTLLPSGRARLHYNHNNFFCDGPSINQLLNDIHHYYDHPDQPLPELALSYRDCVLALADLEETPAGRAARQYWLDRLADWPDAPSLPLVAGADSRDRTRLGRRDFVLPAPVWAAFKRRAAARGLTPTASVCGAYAEIVAYWSGSRHFLLNNMITHRMPLHPQIGEVIGNFAALYPLEVDWRPDEPFRDRVRRLATRMLADLSHTSWSGTKVLQTLNQVRGTPGRAVCPFVIGSGLFMGQLDRPAFSRLETPQVLLDCQFWEQHDGSLWMVWDVFDEMFPNGLIDAMQAGYRSLLCRLAGQDAAWDAEAFPLLPVEQRDGRAEVNRSAAAAPEGLLHRGLAARAAQTPERPYVVAEDRTLSYGETRRRSAALAARLRAEAVRAGDLVAVVLAKGWQQIVAVLATLSAGAAYVPVDPDWPDDRIRYLLARTEAAAVLCLGAAADRLGGLTDAPVIDVGTPAATALDTDLAAGVDQRDVAYVIFTSGSTGRPKGAMLDHLGPLNTVVDINRRFDIGPEDVLLGVSSPCFDLSVYDVFGALEAGATLVLPDPARSTPADWLRLLRDYRVTVWNSVPALMELLVAEAAAADVRLPALRTVLLSGDWVPVQLPSRIREIAPNARVASLGGATEASIWSICHPVDAADPEPVSIPYGRPLANQTWHVLDAHGRDAPTWTAGDLYIGGIGVAVGYLSDPERTRAAFVAHPRTGERLYRTGDRGRYLPDGEIEFLGRADFQVKIQGFRVEPGEVEHTLSGHPAVQQAVVVARGTPSGRQLAAFVLARPETRPDPAELLAHLSDRLPGYLVPSHLSLVDRLPLTANGKIDRLALETVHGADPATTADPVAPRTPLEEALVLAWQEILSARSVGVHDDFFALGGQSFAALRLVTLLRERLGRQVSIGTLLESRTVARLAERLDAETASWSPLVRLAEGGAADPLFLVHPAGGDVLCYRDLAVLIDRPCYAFQAPGPSVGRPVPQTVEGLVREYLPALWSARPSGPYLLGGWSSGAAIAFELAHQLERRGETVRRVVVLDAPAPVAPCEVDEVTSLLWFLENLDIGFDPALVPAQVRRELAALPGDTRLDAVLEVAAQQGARETDAGRAGLGGLLAVFAGVVRACHRYRAPTIAADLTVVRAAEGVVTEFGDHPDAGRPDWGWSALTSGRVDVVAVPATHHAMLGAPHATAVAAAIAERVRHPSTPVG